MYTEELATRMGYLKGLMSGLSFDPASKEGRVFHCLVDVIDQMAEQMSRTRTEIMEMEEYVSALDDDLRDLEDDFYDEYDEGIEYEVESDDGLDFLAIDCPRCRETVYVNEGTLLGSEDVIEVVCPECSETIFVNDGRAEHHLTATHVEM